MMIESSMPIWFWYQACSTAVFLSNRTITKALCGNRSPFEIWHFQKPSIQNFRVFGCQGFHIIRKELQDSEFSPVTSEGVFVGFDHDNFN